jgi:MFS family permease
MKKYRRGLEKNIVLYYFFRIFNKRAYLPLIAIYAVSIAGLDLARFGLIASITAAVSLILEIPSGYLSDRMGHKRSLILGHGIMALSPLAYVVWPDFAGVLLGSAGYFGGYAFISGTSEAFLHETLTELDRPDEYNRIMGRSQAIGLSGNIITIALVPLTYTIDPALPFIVGALLVSVSFWLSFFLTPPHRTEKNVAELEEISFFNLIKALHANKQYLLFLFLGMLGASADKINEFREIYFQTLGIPVVYFGFILAVSSLLAALISYNIHKLEHLREDRYYALSFLVLFLITVISGLVEDARIGIVLMVLLVIYNRNETTLTRGYLLRNSPTRELKATYISMLAFAEALMGIWIPLLIGYLSTTYGISRGYSYFGGFMIILAGTTFLLYLRAKKSARPALA